MSETPRTDEMFTTFNTGQPGAINPADFCRTLETELREALAREASFQKQHEMDTVRFEEMRELGMKRDFELQRLREALVAIKGGEG